jgi:hypothetical protein
MTSKEARAASGSGQGERHVVLEVALPSIYTADLEGLREYQGEFGSESEWLLNCIGEPGVCRLRVEISGEKDSDIEEVWGRVRGAHLAEPRTSEDECADHGWKLLRDIDSCEWCDYERHSPQAETPRAGRSPSLQAGLLVTSPPIEELPEEVVEAMARAGWEAPIDGVEGGPWERIPAGDQRPFLIEMRAALQAALSTGRLTLVPPKNGQRQDSLDDQLHDLMKLAVAHGLYDAHDWMRQALAQVEERDG